MSNPSIKISVIICTHNPRVDYLMRVLQHLQAQTLPVSVWELLLIDNASTDRLADRFDIAWHPFGRHVREDELGLTPARLRGIAEAGNQILVFVDDDNLLDCDYLEHAVALCNCFPFLAAWGGTLRPEFEEAPEDWAKPYVPEVALRDVDSALWTANPRDTSISPVGAGLVIRKIVADAYSKRIEKDNIAKILDRRGSSLMSAGDIDMVLSCPDLGFGFGVFPELGLTHLIPRSRITEDYLARLIYAKSFSWQVLQSNRFKQNSVPKLRHMIQTYIRVLLRRGRRHARMSWAREAGTRSAARWLAKQHDKMP